MFLQFSSQVSRDGAVGKERLDSFGVVVVVEPALVVAVVEDAPAAT